MAYAVDKKDVVRFALANVNPLDTFSRSAGKVQAAKLFEAGQFTSLHIPHVARGGHDSFMKYRLESVLSSARGAQRWVEEEKYQLEKKKAEDAKNVHVVG